MQLDIQEAHLGYYAQDKLDLNDEESQKIASFIEILEENEDIQNIFINA